MHLHYLVEKKNRNCVVSDGIVPAERTIDGETWLGVRLPAQARNRLALPRAADHPHLQTGTTPRAFWRSPAAGPAAVSAASTSRSSLARIASAGRLTC